ncbi:hypothetical protein DFA_08329 [Cavenderia fasciculata]|uniref:Uncharacterized protein n=1 Tax=Cavenderia fasciculata TaxID=261658 RepID=F4Q5S5_CACFS|nr:uncharacterized protein DFA_08329 [Cavenderia fasciculata]EGG17334.1 hypothetical protein DFA_08329 [Cavenderia fasciculata]|eukprot:XP_004355818.1 hypothetical protein DFA_08329 [Cavenderia fasciculata]
MIQFKGIVPINEKGDIEQFIASAPLFNLFSFNDILERNYPDWIQQRITLKDRDDKSNITTALLMYSKLKSLKLLYETIPSIETLFIIQHQSEGEVVDLDSISQYLPNLQSLSVRTDELILGPHSTLKSLKLDITTRCSLVDLGLTKFISLTDLSFKGSFLTNIGPGLFPSSLTSLTVRLTEVPPRDTFLSLTSLVKLKIGLKEDIEVEDQPHIDLDSLLNLKVLVFNFDYFLIQIDEDINCSIEISVPPSLKILTIWSSSVVIPSRCSMPLLEKFYVYQSILVTGRINLSQCPSIMKLFIYQCTEPVIIPSTIKKLTIDKDTLKRKILGQIKFPPLLTHLSIKGQHCESVVFPQSLVKLKQTFNSQSQLFNLPQNLKKLTWEVDWETSLPKLFSSGHPLPPNLETLKVITIDDNSLIKVPPPTKYLSIFLDQNLSPENLPIYRIGSRIFKIINQPQWLPLNTTHLTCYLRESKIAPKTIFRLDEVINHTNVRYLTLHFSQTTYQFSIQRLDSDNLNDGLQFLWHGVLKLEKM